MKVLLKIRNDRGVEQQVARWAHNPKAGGSNPSSATSKKPLNYQWLFFIYHVFIFLQYFGTIGITPFILTFQLLNFLSRNERKRGKIKWDDFFGIRFFTFRFDGIFFVNSSQFKVDDILL